MFGFFAWTLDVLPYCFVDNVIVFFVFFVCWYFRSAFVFAGLFFFVELENWGRFFDRLFFSCWSLQGWPYQHAVAILGLVCGSGSWCGLWFCIFFGKLPCIF